jgi:hypothetical protein
LFDFLLVLLSSEWSILILLGLSGIDKERKVIERTLAYQVGGPSSLCSQQRIIFLWMNWELKLLVASLFATSASFSPFFSLFMQDKGFDALQIGTMISFSRVIMLLSTPTACAYADRHGAHRGLLATLAALAGGVILLFPFAPPGSFYTVAAIFALYSICCGSKLAICDTIVLHACKGFAEKYPLQRLWGSISWGVVAMAIGFFLRWYHRVQGLSITYELVPVIHSIFQFCFAAVLMTFIPPTSPGTALPSSAKEDEEPLEECEGSTGDEHAPILADAQVNRSLMSVDVTGPLSSMTASSSTAGPRRSNASRSGRNGSHANALSQTSASAASTAPPQSVFAVLRSYVKLSQDRRIFFPVVLGVSLLSLSEVAMNNFLFPYLRRALKAPPELFSYVLAIHAASEVVAFTMGSRLMQILGPRALLMASSLAFCAKATWYAILEDPWSLLYVETLHGVCFALMWTAAVAHVSRIADSIGGGGGGSQGTAGKDAKASGNVRAASMAMTTLWFFANGLPNILGGVLSGYVVQNSEAQEVALFQVVGALSFAVAVLFWFYGVFGCFDAASTTTVAGNGNGSGSANSGERTGGHSNQAAV